MLERLIGEAVSSLCIRLLELTSDLKLGKK